MADIGYARVSSDDQQLRMQRHALKAIGCKKIFEDFDRSAVSDRREAFDAALAYLRPGDRLVIWSIDRAFRDVRQALDTMDLLRARNVSLHSIIESAFDMTTAHGRLTYTIRNAFSQYESELISERTKAGMEEARRQGAEIGRPRKLTKKKLRKMRALFKEGRSCRYVAWRLRVSDRTLRRAIATRL